MVQLAVHCIPLAQTLHTMESLNHGIMHLFLMKELLQAQS
jgi:hypothetical protein